MNELLNLHSNSIIKRASCLAIGLALALACQQSVAQSVATPPKVSPKAAAIGLQIAGFESSLKAQAKEISQLQDQLVAKEDELLALKERKSKLTISEESYSEVLKTLHSQRVQLSIDLAGIDARYEAIAKAIKTVSEKQDVEFVKPYKRLLELRELKLKQLDESDDATPQQKQTAEIELLKAKLQLAEAMKPSSSLSLLNAQLLDSSLERAEKTARLEKANSLFTETDQYRANSEAIMKNQSSSGFARNQLSNLLRQEKATKSELERFRKELRLLNANED